MRIDKYLSEIFGSRTKAATAINKGLVLVNGKTVDPAYDFKGSESLTFIQAEESYVSAGGFKLSKALKEFEFSVKDKVFADIGASTGGFTDCLLKNGARKVYCIDVGESQLDKSLICEKTVVVDHYNARNLEKSLFSEELDGIVIDVSFISLTYILNAVGRVLSDGASVIALIKPQFECERIGLNGNGILPFKYHAKLLASFYDYCLAVGLPVQNITNAPIVEKKNIEYVLFLKKHPEALGKEIFLRRAAEISI